MKALKIISKNCVGCEVCGIVCSTKHDGQVRESAMRIRVNDRYPEIKMPVFRPMVCKHCDDPECVEACPLGALEIDKDTGQILLHESKCDGCGECIDACPFDAMWIDPLKNIAIKCDLCGGDPLCVKFCNFDAIRFE